MRQPISPPDDEEAGPLEMTRMRRRHLQGVMAIERQVYPRPWSPNLFLAEMSELRNRPTSWPSSDREVVGYGGLMAYGDEAHVTTIAVDPAHHRRRSGPGCCTSWCRQAHRAWAPRPCRSRSGSSNWGAQRLYSRFGFRPVGIRKGYYQETNEDALVMWTDDIRTPEYRARLAADRCRPGPRPTSGPRDPGGGAATAIGPPDDPDDARPRASRPPATRRRWRWSRTAATVRSNLISSQVHLHERFGGVVPEVASRAHLERINPMIELALDEAGLAIGDVDAVAATRRPGPGRRPAGGDGRGQGPGVRAGACRSSA